MALSERLKLKENESLGRFQLPVTENSAQNYSDSRCIGSSIRESGYSEGFSTVGP